VGSLLEVGTGFHPELTGRENVFLNGAILGMRRSEIRRRFDSIVDFAGVEQFIDTPVKHYSSGMYVRLAFAVAAHLESEVLIVDEVLAVGDLEFQRKCLGKMQDVATSGRTVLFVSHNMSAVQRLCKRGVLLRRGKVAAAGPIDDVVGEYLSYLRESAATAFTGDNPERLGTGAVRVMAAQVLDELGNPTKHLRAGRPATFQFHYRNPTGARSANIFMTLYNQVGVACTQFDMSLSNNVAAELAEQGVFRCHVPCVPFPIGDYRVAMSVDVDGEHADLVPNALAFTVETSTFFPTPRTPSTTYCAVMVEHEWEHAAGAASDEATVVSGAQGDADPG
jgi:lipopolysaccharide transport system ATP-binding protein